MSVKRFFVGDGDFCTWQVYDRTVGVTGASVCSCFTRTNARMVCDALNAFKPAGRVKTRATEAK